MLGRKRHILTDTLGLLLAVNVHPASVQDRDGAEALLREARRSFPFLERIIADAGYQGRKMDAAVSRTGTWVLQIVRRCDRHRFVVLPKRWIVERTLAWISCFRNGPLRVNPPFQSRRRLLASVRGRHAGRPLMWSEGRESPSVERSVAATRCPASSHPPSRRRDTREHASKGLLDPFLFCSDGYQVRRRFFGREGARPRAPNGAHYLAVISP